MGATKIPEVLGSCKRLQTCSDSCWSNMSGEGTKVNHVSPLGFDNPLDSQESVLQRKAERCNLVSKACQQKPRSTEHHKRKSKENCLDLQSSSSLSVYRKQLKADQRSTLKVVLGPSRAKEANLTQSPEDSNAQLLLSQRGSSPPDWRY